MDKGLGIKATIRATVTNKVKEEVFGERIFRFLQVMTIGDNSMNTSTRMGMIPKWSLRAKMKMK